MTKRIEPPEPANDNEPRGPQTRDPADPGEHAGTVPNASTREAAGVLDAAGDSAASLLGGATARGEMASAGSGVAAFGGDGGELHRGELHASGEGTASFGAPQQVTQR